MTNTRKYIDIDDYGNLENIIKKVDPSFSDMVQYLPGPIANFAQQKMSMAVKQEEAKEGDGLKPMQKYLLMKGANNAS